MTILYNNVCSSNINNYKFSILLCIMFVLSNYNEIIVRTLRILVFRHFAAQCQFYFLFSP